MIPIRRGGQQSAQVGSGFEHASEVSCRSTVAGLSRFCLDMCLCLGRGKLDWSITQTSAQPGTFLEEQHSECFRNQLSLRGALRVWGIREVTGSPRICEDLPVRLGSLPGLGRSP